jgi:hypothetical protein
VSQIHRCRRFIGVAERSYVPNTPCGRTRGGAAWERVLHCNQGSDNPDNETNNSARSYRYSQNPLLLLMFRDKGCERSASLSGTRDGLSQVKRQLMYLRWCTVVEARLLLFVATHSYSTVPVRHGRQFRPLQLVIDSLACHQSIYFTSSTVDPAPTPSHASFCSLTGHRLRAGRSRYPTWR